MSSNNHNKALVSVLQNVRKSISEQVQPGAGVSIDPSQAEALKPKMKPKKVIFDKSTGSPFEVVFSERGFLVENTRLSFEELETAISKNYNVGLNGGKGLVLDAVKMQKILKYKDLY